MLAVIFQRKKNFFCQDKQIWAKTCEKFSKEKEIFLGPRQTSPQKSCVSINTKGAKGIWTRNCCYCCMYLISSHLCHLTKKVLKYKSFTWCSSVFFKSNPEADKSRQNEGVKEIQSKLTPPAIKVTPRAWFFSKV